MADIGLTFKGFNALQGRMRQTAKFLKEKMKEVIDKGGYEVQKNYKKTTRTWNNQPTFGFDKRINNKQYSVEIGTNDKVYKFIEEGTRVRRAMMTPDFRAKTKPGWLGSKNGRGGVLFISRKLALPGIEAREFRQPILRKAKTMLRKDSKIAVKSVTSRFGN
jgi:hypothetical protein